jgi:hypothetical protein
MSVTQAIASFFVLILFMLAVMAIVYVPLFAIFKFIEFVSRQEFMQKFVNKLRTMIGEWWNKHKTPFMSIFEFVSEILIDPIFYGYAVAALYQRIQSVADYTENNIQYSFWELWDLDIQTDATFYTIFFIIFIIWVICRTWQSKQKALENKAVNDKLDLLIALMPRNKTHKIIKQNKSYKV